MMLWRSFNRARTQIRHNSCASQQRLWMSHAPEDGERIAPKGYTSLATLEAHVSMITAAQAEGLQMRMPLGMREAGWVVLPSGGTFTSHRLDYAYIEKSAEEQQEARHAAASRVSDSRTSTKATCASPSRTGSSIAR